MTGIKAAILYYRTHKDDKDWGEADEAITECLAAEEIKYNPLEDTLECN